MSKLIMFQVEQLHDITFQKRVSEEEFGTKPDCLVFGKDKLFPAMWKLQEQLLVRRHLFTFD